MYQRVFTHSVSTGKCADTEGLKNASTYRLQRPTCEMRVTGSNPSEGMVYKKMYAAIHAYPAVKDSNLGGWIS